MSTRPSFRLLLLSIVALLFAASMTLAGTLSHLAPAVVPDQARPGFETIQPRNLQAVLGFLASEQLEGRGTAQRGAGLAAAYLQSLFTLFGLQPVPGQSSMLQTFHIISSRLLPTTALILVDSSSAPAKVEKFALFEDFYVVTRGSRTATIGAPIVVCKTGVFESLGSEHLEPLKSKLLLLVPDDLENQYGPDDRDRRRGRSDFDVRRYADRAQELGVSALLLASPRPIGTMMARFRRWLQRPNYALLEEAEPLPVVVISSDLVSKLIASLSEKGTAVKTASLPDVPVPLPRIHLTLQLDIEADIEEAQNVVAFLPGEKAELQQEVVAFSAHYDHLGVSGNGVVYPGADDNASGTAALVEIARAFAANPLRPRRSLLFIAHTGEERGLLGSRYFTRHPLIPLDRFQALINMDMIGRNDSSSVYVIGSNFLSQELHAINEASAAVVGLHLDYRYNSVNDPNRFYFRSDHYNYARHHIPILFLFTGTHEDYHQPSDTADKINFAKMAQVARLAYLNGWHLANLNHRLPLDGLMMQK